MNDTSKKRLAQLEELETGKHLDRAELAELDALRAIDEGYSGTPALCRALIQLPGLEIKSAEYRQLLKEHK